MYWENKCNTNSNIKAQQNSFQKGGLWAHEKRAEDWAWGGDRNIAQR